MINQKNDDPQYVGLYSPCSLLKSSTNCFFEVFNRFYHPGKPDILPWKIHLFFHERSGQDRTDRTGEVSKKITNLKRLRHSGLKPIQSPFSMVRSHQITIFGCLPSGKHAKNELENHHAINGKTHYFDWAMASIAIINQLYKSPWKSPFSYGSIPLNHHFS